MATLVLGTVGRAFGGPLGGIIGSAVGGFVDRGLFGGRGGDGGRLGNLAVQSAAYGEAIPVISGRMRAAGNLIWTSGIVESAGGGGKRNGGGTSAYSYSASFAVGLAGREIADVGRIWADGRLIRGADGVFLSPTIMRLHRGGEAQPVDPLIAAAEAAEQAPAYRGLAYAVFEDLALADFGNRIPNLTFEIIADAGDAMNAGRAISALASVEGRGVADVSGVFPAIKGHFSGVAGSVADAIAGLINMAGGAVVAGDGLAVTGGATGAPVTIAAGETQARAAGEARSRERRQRLAGDARTQAIEIGYFDVDRDYQPGLQRLGSGETGPAAQQAVACAMDAGQAKSLALATLSRVGPAGLSTTCRLPWRYAGVKPGDHVQIGDDPVRWRVREVRFESFVINLALERAESLPSVSLSGSSGRALSFDDQPAGPSVVHLLALPRLPGDADAGAKLWVAAAGTSAGWRRAAIEASADGGASYVSVGVIQGGTIMGVVASRLAAPGDEAADMVEVELLSERMWLESRGEASILAGANLALIGDELVQFRRAEAIAPRRFRLSGLSRGVHGSDGGATDHKAGERFVLLDRTAMLAIPVAGDAAGLGYRARACGAGDASTEHVELRLSSVA